MISYMRECQIVIFLDYYTFCHYSQCQLLDSTPVPFLVIAMIPHPKEEEEEEYLLNNFILFLICESKFRFSETNALSLLFPKEYLSN